MRVSIPRPESVHPGDNDDPFEACEDENEDAEIVAGGEPGSSVSVSSVLEEGLLGVPLASVELDDEDDRPPCPGRPLLGARPSWVDGLPLIGVVAAKAIVDETAGQPG